jgi:hypothetical protein
MDNLNNYKMEQLQVSRTQQVKRYLVNKIPEMSAKELLMIQSIIQKQLHAATPQEENNSIDSTQHNDWEMLKGKLQSKIRNQLLYNAIQSRLMSNSHVFE